MTDKPIPYTEETADLSALALGFQGKRISFDWRPYHLRTAAARADFDRLLVSIFHRGILKPLITYQGHVLIGQRRAEIGMRLHLGVVRVWEVQEDVSKWWKPDVARLAKLKAKMGEASY